MMSTIEHIEGMRNRAIERERDKAKDGVYALYIYIENELLISWRVSVKWETWF